MRSLELLLRTYPTKTGEEILEIQQQDRLEDQKAYEEHNKAKLDLIEDINTNGGYFRGRFGKDQYFYYSFKNLDLSEDTIFCEVKTIVCFDWENGQKEISVRNKEYQVFENYDINMYDRITKEEFDKISNYLTDIFPTFWPTKE